MVRGGAIVVQMVRFCYSSVVIKPGKYKRMSPDGSICGSRWFDSRFAMVRFAVRDGSIRGSRWFDLRFEMVRFAVHGVGLPLALDFRV